MNRKTAAAPRLAFDRYAATVRLNDVLDEREAEPASLHVMHKPCADAIEFLENLILLLSRNAYPLICDGQTYLLALLFKANNYLFGRAGILNGVVEQVHERLRDG